MLKNCTDKANAPNWKQPSLDTLVVTQVYTRSGVLRPVPGGALDPRLLCPVLQGLPCTPLHSQIVLVFSGDNDGLVCHHPANTRIGAVSRELGAIRGEGEESGPRPHQCDKGTHYCGPTKER